MKKIIITLLCLSLLILLCGAVNPEPEPEAEPPPHTLSPENQAFLDEALEQMREYEIMIEEYNNSRTERQAEEITAPEEADCVLTVEAEEPLPFMKRKSVLDVIKENFISLTLVAAVGIAFFIIRMKSKNKDEMEAEI